MRLTLTELGAPRIAIAARSSRFTLNLLITISILVRVTNGIEQKKYEVSDEE